LGILAFTSKVFRRASGYLPLKIGWIGVYLMFQWKPVSLEPAYKSLEMVFSYLSMLLVFPFDFRDLLRYGLLWVVVVFMGSTPYGNSPSSSRMEE
jgi:hypothetical protein